jgi:FMN phosphatase YigB (HAD superfamily)
LKGRSHLGPYLYEDTLPCLEYLRSLPSLSLCILTDGNCNFELDESSSHLKIEPFFHHILSAAEVGRSKPCYLGFLSLIQRLGNIPPSRILFLGDAYEKDVLGAKAMGMKTGFLVRNKQEFEKILNDEDHVYHPKKYKENHIDCLLNNLYPDHVIERMNFHKEIIVKLDSKN